MSPRRIGLVVFDIGRVMIRLCGGWEDACNRAGVAFRPELLTPAVQERLLRLTFLYETGQAGHDVWINGVAELAHCSPQQSRAMLEGWLDGPYPGWHELLAKLDEAQVQTACLSNTNAIHWAMMHDDASPHRLPLDRLRHRFASHLVGAHKPDAAIYRHVEKHTGVTPRAILFFDDVAANVEAARARGWAGHVIDHPGDPVRQIHDALVGHGVLRP